MKAVARQETPRSLDGPVEIRVLEAVMVQLAGRRVPLGDAKHRLMLAMLVAAEGRLIPTGQLIDQIWDGEPPRTARNLVHSYASDLRRSLAAGREGSAEMLPRHHDGGYQLLVSRENVDLCRFRDLRARARPLARNDDAQAAALLRQALSQWGAGGGPGGGPLTDMNGTPVADCRWLQAYRHTLREEHRATLIERLKAELRLGEHERITAELADLAAADPPDERIAGMLLIACYRSGRQGEATLAYQRTRKRLLTELGVEPGPDLRDLHQKILNQDPQLDLPAAPEARTEVGRADRSELLTATAPAGHPTAPAGQRAAPAGQPAAPAEQIVAAVTDFSTLIAERTEDFVGRRQFGALLWKTFDDAALRSGYLFVSGEPGIGKTALLAKLVRERELVHHFNSVLTGITSREKFLRNICAQLVLRFDLAYERLPADSTSDSSFLLGLLAQASARQRVVIAVDAIDEAAMAEEAQNRLFLPPTLPPDVFFVVTTRHPEDMEFYVDERRDMLLDERDPENGADLREYLNMFLERHRRAMTRRLAALGISERAFVETLVDRSEGNFMYLRHVLRAIRDGTLGGTGGGRVGELPRGLKAYYAHLEQQLVRLASADPDRDLAILGVLAAWPAPLTVPRLSRFAGERVSLTRGVLRRWAPFLNESPVGGEPGYALYHASFREFLAERLDMSDVRARIARAIEGGQA